MNGEWQRHVHCEEVWGTVVTMDLRAPVIDRDAARQACSAAAAELHRIDEWLSPYRADSAVSQIRNGTLRLADAPEPVLDVINGCAEVTRHSKGAFNPWKLTGGFDPSGFVKGWGADRAARILQVHGFANVSVNAAGDVTCRGQSAADIPGWRIGIADPRDRTQVISSVLIKDAHLATSGRYENGDHIVDPNSRRAVLTVDCASVLAKDGGFADAYATSLFVLGPSGLAELKPLGAAALLITGGQIWSVGDQFSRQRTSPA